MNEIRERYALRNLILIAGTLANAALFLTVSYTHLTLPTILRV